ncbi:MAG: hypothetical protein K8S27_09775 [Candidatus Omnitrophica bacterium]|nr:hypothetical protein [Candidatus Omnitrophota bacterium]
MKMEATYEIYKNLAIWISLIGISFLVLGLIVFKTVDIVLIIIGVLFLFGAFLCHTSSKRFKELTFLRIEGGMVVPVD